MSLQGVISLKMWMLYGISIVFVLASLQCAFLDIYVVFKSRSPIRISAWAFCFDLSTPCAQEIIVDSSDYLQMTGLLEFVAPRDAPSFHGLQCDDSMMIVLYIAFMWFIKVLTVALSLASSNETYSIFLRNSSKCHHNYWTALDHY